MIDVKETRWLRTAAILLLSVMVAVSMIPLTAHASVQENVTIGDYDYTIYDGTDDDSGISVWITGYHGTDVEIEVPTTVTYKNKTYSDVFIGQNAFKANTTIEKVRIPEGCDYIGSYAFSGCTSLTEIAIQNGSLNLGLNAFSECPNLQTYRLNGAATITQVINSGIGKDAAGNVYENVTVYTKGDSIVAEAIGDTEDPAFDHSGNTINARSLSVGGATIKLEYDDDPYEKNEVHPHSHMWNNGTVTKEATCTAKGEKTYTCASCGKTKTEAIASLGHKYGAWTKLNATQHQRVCSRDNSHVEKANHTWDGGKVTKAATTDAAGVKTFTCTACKATKTASIPKLKPATSYSKGATSKAVDKAITKLKNDADPKGTTFSMLQMRVKSTAKTSITLQWVGAKGAKKFVVYGNNCNVGKKKYKYVKLMTTTKKTVKFTKIKKTKMKKGTFYKFMVVALDKNGKVLATSKTVHVATKGGKTWNYKSVTIPKKVITKAKSLKKGKTLKLNAKAVLDKKIKVKAHRQISYESSNPAIASVTSKGVVKGKKAGSCFVYAYAQNGVFKKIKVTVK